MCKLCKEEIGGTLALDQHSLFDEGIKKILYYCIYGVPYLSQSCKERCARYLREYDGDIKQAIDAAISKNHSFYAKITRAFIVSLPIVGIPPALVMPLWRQLRDIALIAALNGHDVESEEVQKRIIRCLALDSSLLPLPIQSITTTIAARTISTQISPIIGRQVVENVAAQTGATVVKTASEKASTEGIYAVGYMLGGSFGEFLAKKFTENTAASAVVGQVTSKAMTTAVNSEVGHTVLVNAAKNIPQVKSATSVGSAAVSGVLGMAVGIPLAFIVDYFMDNSRAIFAFAAVVFSTVV